MEPACRIADQLVKARFHVHVDVFEFGIPLELTGLYFGHDLGKTVNDSVDVVCRNYALATQHAGVCDRAFDVFVVKPTIVVDRNGEIARELATAGSGRGIFVCVVVFVGHRF